MTTIDMTDTIQPKSDQANADDFLSGPRTFTIAEVRKTGTDEQPFAVRLAEFPADRPYKPSKSMRRVLVSAWGSDGSAYVGKRLTLFRDPEVKFGSDKVGGIKISHMSDLPGGKPLRIALTVTRGKRSPYVVDPLPDAAPSSPAVSAETLATLTETLQRKGVAEDDWLRGVNHYTGGAATALEVITEAQAHVVLAQLAKRADVDTTAAAADGEQCAVCGAHDGQPHDEGAHDEAGVPL